MWDLMGHHLSHHSVAGTAGPVPWNLMHGLLRMWEAWRLPSDSSLSPRISRPPEQAIWRLSMPPLLPVWLPRTPPCHVSETDLVLSSRKPGNAVSGGLYP